MWQSGLSNTPSWFIPLLANVTRHMGPSAYPRDAVLTINLGQFRIGYVLVTESKIQLVPRAYQQHDTPVASTRRISSVSSLPNIGKMGGREYTLTFAIGPDSLGA